MQRPLLLFPALLTLALAACAPGESSAADAKLEPAGVAQPDGSHTFGTPLELDPTPLADVLSDPESFTGQQLSLEGELVEVCAASGCWFELGSGDAQLMVVLRDTEGTKYGIPTESTGRAQATGELEAGPTGPRLIARGVRLLPSPEAPQ